MNREIKFRGKKLYEDGWSYGYFAKLSNGKCYIMYDWCSSGDWVHDEVHPETVGQFINAVDINGKEIYEGDIVGEARIIIKHELGSIYAGGGGMSGDSWVQDVFFSGFKSTNRSFNYCEVVGNIHDNPELIKP